MCCGKKRAQARRGEPAESRSAARTEAIRLLEQEPADAIAYFQYLGKTSLIVQGPRTQKQYRFSHPGAVVAVDPLDKRALSAVTILRRVAKRPSS